MSYAPSTFHAGTGEDFFRKEGFLVDGMAPLISARYTIPAFDDYDGTAVTITNSVAKSASGEAYSWSGWDLAAAKTKLLAIAYVHPATTDIVGIGFHNGTLPTSTLQDSYQAFYYGQQAKTELGKYTAGGYGELETEAAIRQDDAATVPVWGIALYVEDDIQKVFVKSGTANWLQVLADTDEDHDSFQSFFLWHDGTSARYITPMMVWGS